MGFQISIGKKTFNFGSGKNIQIRNGVVTIDGKVQDAALGEIAVLKIVEGTIQNLDTDASVNCRNIAGDVRAGGSVNCDDIKGSVTAGGSVQVNK